MIMRQKRVLIADDETHILNVLSIKLQNAGFAVTQAEDGLSACNLARSEPPDLIITDYHMPGLSGLELCLRLQSEPATREIPVIMLTARGLAISDEERKHANILRMIDKPFSPREVLSCVNELLDLVPSGAP